MKSLLSSLALLTATTSAEANIEGVSCVITDWDSFSFWDLSDLTMENGNYVRDGVEFNFCKYAVWP